MVIHCQCHRATILVGKQLGGKAFAAARSEGRTMSLEQALATTWSSAVVSPPPSPRYPDGLTEREVEVLCLLSKGFTDEQIARQIGPRIAATRYVIDRDLC